VPLTRHATADSPTHFARRYDKSGSYIRTWLPALRRMPDDFIYAPWTAPLEVQRAASCVIGTDYPSPMCDVEAAAHANLRRMDACYRAAPDEWRAMVPPSAAAEVAKERDVDVRPSRRVDPFVPLRRALPPSPPPQPPPPPPAVHAAPSSVASNVAHDHATPRMGGSMVAGRRGRAQGRGRVSRVQHGFR
jgi:hypothetical protein